MGISGVGPQGDNPFLKKMHDDIAGLGYNPQVNKDDGNLTVKPNESGKVDKASETEKTGTKEMAAQANVSNQGQNLIDKTQFTNENDIQEIDMKDFQDDM